MQAAAQHQAHANACTHGDEGKRAHVATVAVVPLGQCGQVDVVLEHHVGPEGPAQVGHHAGLPPAGQAGGQGQGVASRVVDPGATHHDVGDGVRGDPGRLRQLGGQADQLGHPDMALGRMDTSPAPGPHHAGQVGHRAPEELPAHVHRQYETCLGVDLIEHGRGPTTALAPAGQAYQPIALQVGQAQPHRRLREPADAREIRPHQRPVPSQGVDQALFVHSPEQLRPAGQAC